MSVEKVDLCLDRDECCKHGQEEESLEALQCYLRELKLDKKQAKEDFEFCCDQIVIVEEMIEKSINRCECKE